MEQEEKKISQQWRKRLEEIGQDAYEFEEMTRLGFLGEKKVTEMIKASGITLEEYEKAKVKLSDISRSLNETTKEIESIGSVQEALEKIRAQRIKRTKEKNKARKLKKEAQLKERRKLIHEQQINCPTFLGRDVSNRLNFSGGNAQENELKGVPFISSFLELSSALNLKPETLQWLVYERDSAKIDHYTRFEIPKRTGGRRLISSPKPSLRRAQKWILDSMLNKLDTHSAAMAFRPKLSILDNAKLHANSKVVVRMDIKDFFPSITFARIRGFFESLGYNPGVSTVLSLICTDSPRVTLKHLGETYFVKVGSRNLPQGACTSPALANLIANKLDRRLQKYTQKVNWVYSRYADDLIFSSNTESMPPYRLIKAVSMIVGDEGFIVNKKKTSIMRSPHRQVVTGLVVNKDVRISRKDLRRFRAFFHRCETQGLTNVSNDLGKDALSMAKGFLAYISMISPDLGTKISQKHLWISSQ